MTMLKPLFISVLTVMGFHTSLSFADTCPDSHTNVSNVNACTVIGTHASIQLNFISGFSSSSSANPIDGNFGTTIGEQRRLAYIKAAEILAEHIHSPQVIEVDARFSNLECDNDSAVLGSAGAMASIAFEASDGVAGVPLDTFFPIALANAILDEDIDPGFADIEAEFNSQIGNSNCLSGVEWYYGYEQATGQDINFVSVLLHEITHGLGFSSIVNPATGAKPTDQNNNALDDIFSNFLFDANENDTWNNLSSLERRNSAVNDNLFWDGNHANQQAVGVLTAGYSNEDSSSVFSLGDRIKMYAPNELKLGSSVSHFDSVLIPNELMEPNLSDVTCTIGLAYGVLEDIGWEITYPSTGFQLNHQCRTFNNGDTLTSLQGNDTLFVSSVSDHAISSVSLSYQGNDVSNLVTSLDNGFLIGIPSNGEFAGSYTLTISNGVDADISITIERSLLIEWSAQALLTGKDYTFKVSGGAANSIYELSSDPVNVITFKNSANDPIVSITAINDGQNSNPAQTALNAANVITQTQVTTTVRSQSNAYEDVNSRLEVYPALTHDIHIVDTQNNAINQAEITLRNDTLIRAMDIETDYVSDENGELTINLPDVDDTSFRLTIVKDGFDTETYFISNTTQQHSITLSDSQITEPEEEQDNLVETPKAKTKSGGSLTLFCLLLATTLLLGRNGRKAQIFS